MNNISQRKPVGILLGSHFGVEREILVCFSSAGYEIYHAPTLDEARLYFDTINFDFIFCFENFAEGPTLDFICTLSHEKFKNAIALVDHGRSGKLCGEGVPRISHMFYAFTSPAILQYFVDQLFRIKRVAVEACPN